MSARSILGPVVPRAGLTRVDGTAVAVLSAGVLALLLLTKPEDGLVYLLSFPIWIIARDMGGLAGLAAAVVALALLGLHGATQGVDVGPLGYLGCAVAYLGAVGAGARVLQPGRSTPEPAPELPTLTERPEVEAHAETLSRRELQVLEQVATGANNAQIAERFVISENTVKSHISRILRKLPAHNRTEAAFRYLELYGAPTLNGDRITAADATKATVADLGSDNDMLLRLHDGRELEVPLPDDLGDRVEVGASAIVYFDHADREIGWFLPDEEVGVDLRQWVS
jgi:DNA-binding CsgD family transcriptional regulator